MEEDKKLNFLLTATFVASLAVRLMYEDIENRTPLKKDFKQDMRFSIGRIVKDIEDAKRVYDTKIHPHIVNEFCKDTGFECENYDNNLSDANECCRLMLTYWNKCFGNQDNVNKVFAFLNSLSGTDVFTESDIKHYTLKNG